MNQQLYRVGEVLRLDSATYELTAIRKGGMATVFLLDRVGHSENIMVYKSKLACKVFDQQQLDDEQLKNELNIWINLKHENIVPLLSLSHLNYRLTAVMPLYNNSLRDMLAEHGHIQWVEALNILRQIASALQYAASAYDVVHLDIKPENVLCQSPSKGIAAHLSDWGMATIQKSVLGTNTSLQDHSQTYAGFGTLPYMAPERLLGEGAANQSMDVYSVGIMIYECLVGHLPYRAQTASELGMEIVENRYMDVVRSSSSSLGRAGVEVLQKALNPVPDRRYASAMEFYSALRWVSLKKKAFGLFGRRG